MTHIFVPVIRYSSPSRTARHVIALVSLPASGSESDSAPRISPLASRGSQRLRCSSVPLAFSRFAAMTCVLSTPDNDIHPAASSSITPQYVGRSRPSPPCSSGMVTPNSPRSRMPSTIAAGYSSACSSSDATGSTSRSTKRRTVPTSSARTSGSVAIEASLRVAPQRLGELGAATNAELLVGALEVVLDRARRHHDGLGDLPAGQPAGCESRHLPLALGERDGLRGRLEGGAPRAFAATVGATSRTSTTENAASMITFAPATTRLSGDSSHRPAHDSTGGAEKNMLRNNVSDAGA